MLGYVKPFADELKVSEYKQYKMYYCSICKAMGKYTFVGRIMLAYDTVFLALLADEKVNTTHCKGCILCLHKCSYQHNSSISYSAAVNVILAYFKLKDSIADGNKLASLPKTALYLPYKKAANAEPLANTIIKSSLEAIFKLENESCLPQEAAEKFGEMCANLTMLAMQQKDETYQRVAKILAYYIGCWIYWIDAVEDFEKDIKKDRFNAIIMQMNIARQSRQAAMLFAKEQMQKALKQARLVLELLECKNYSIIENIIVYSLPFKTKKVLGREGIEYEFI